MKIGKLICAALTLVAVCGICASCGSANNEAAMTDIHVSADGNDKSGDGSVENPFATVERAAKCVAPGTTINVHEGTYAPFEIGPEMSGTEDDPVILCAPDGERVIIDATVDNEDESIGIHMVNVDNIILNGFEVVGGTHGIFYESTTEQGETPLENISITNCTVHDVTGTHGICAYARNDMAPVKNLIMANCEVYNNRCDSSESTVFNGNIDGFTIVNNVIHDNNNIGIDMIGFEGTAKHEGGDANEYEVDFVRNGECHDNVVYNISAFDNEAYNEEGEYDLCADGIYVDGGQDIKIYNNFIYNCDIGIEVATEHSPDDNELFKVSGVEVYDNTIASCMGWCGLAFGGYDADLGYTENCEFHNNTFIDNDSQIGVQRSRDNKIYDNVFVGSESIYDMNTDCRDEDLINDIGDNLEVSDADRDTVLDGINTKGDKGSGFEIAPSWGELYEKYLGEGQEGIENAEAALEEIIGDGISIDSIAEYDNNVEKYINDQLAKAGLEKATVQVMSSSSDAVNTSRLAGLNGNVDAAALEGEANIGLHLRYEYSDNTWTNAWIQDVTLTK